MRKSNTTSQIYTIQELNRVNTLFVSRKLALAAQTLRKETNLSMTEIAHKLELSSPASVEMLILRHGKKGANEKV